MENALVRYFKYTQVVNVSEMEFLSLNRRRSSARNVPSGEERGGTDISQAKTISNYCQLASSNFIP